MKVCVYNLLFHHDLYLSIKIKPIFKGKEINNIMYYMPIEKSAHSTLQNKQAYMTQCKILFAHVINVNSRVLHVL